MSENLPLVVDVKRGATEDGPGIRTTVFFKGCPMACAWCQNPEAIAPFVEIGFYPRRCIGCDECAEVCPEGAVRTGSVERIDRSKCTRCGLCAQNCPARALREIGKYHEVDSLLEIILRDRVFYTTSGGGVTLSGGEPALWPDFVGKLLRRLKAENIHVVLQTGGCFEYAAFEEAILPWLDAVFFDIKILDRDEHYRHTGKHNDLILENFRRLLEEGVEVVPRVPLIPGYTISAANLSGIAGFLERCGFRDFPLLPYNSLGSAKWDRLGKPRPDLPEGWMSRTEVEQYRKLCRKSPRPAEKVTQTGL